MTGIDGVTRGEWEALVRVAEVGADLLTKVSLLTVLAEGAGIVTRAKGEWPLDEAAADIAKASIAAEAIRRALGIPS